MVVSTLENGLFSNLLPLKGQMLILIPLSKANVTATEFSNGPMAHVTRVSGATTVPMAMANLCMQTVMCMKVIGKKIKLMGEGPIDMRMGHSMWGSGGRTSSMGKVRRPGRMGHTMRGSTRWGRSMGKANSYLLKGRSMRGSLRIMRFQAKVSTSGQMEKCTSVNGKTIKCKVKGYSLGPTVNAMKGNFMMIREMAKEFSLGLMARNT